MQQLQYEIQDGKASSLTVPRDNWKLRGCRRWRWWDKGQPPTLNSTSRRYSWCDSAAARSGSSNLPCSSRPGNRRSRGGGRFSCFRISRDVGGFCTRCPGRHACNLPLLSSSFLAFRSETLRLGFYQNPNHRLFFFLAFWSAVFLVPPRHTGTAN